METRDWYDIRFQAPADARTCFDGTGRWRTHYLFAPDNLAMLQAITYCGHRAGAIPGGSTVDCPDCLEREAEDEDAPDLDDLLPGDGREDPPDGTVNANGAVWGQRRWHLVGVTDIHVRTNRGPATWHQATCSCGWSDMNEWSPSRRAEAIKDGKRHNGGDGA